MLRNERAQTRRAPLHVTPVISSLDKSGGHPCRVQFLTGNGSASSLPGSLSVINSSLQFTHLFLQLIHRVSQVVILAVVWLFGFRCFLCWFV